MLATRRLLKAKRAYGFRGLQPIATGFSVLFGGSIIVVCSQRGLRSILCKNRPSGIFVCVDNVIAILIRIACVFGDTRPELSVSTKYGLTFSEDKSAISAKTIKVLGFEGCVRSDPKSYPSPRPQNKGKHWGSLHTILSLFLTPDKSNPSITNRILMLPACVVHCFKSVKKARKFNAGNR